MYVSCLCASLPVSVCCLNPLDASIHALVKMANSEKMVGWHDGLARPLY